MTNTNVGLKRNKKIREINAGVPLWPSLQCRTLLFLLHSHIPQMLQKTCLFDQFTWFNVNLNSKMTENNRKIQKWPILPRRWYSTPIFFNIYSNQHSELFPFSNPAFFAFLIAWILSLHSKYFGIYTLAMIKTDFMKLIILKCFIF